jgi:hypothetical protein
MAAGDTDRVAHRSPDHLQLESTIEAYADEHAHSDTDPDTDEAVRTASTNGHTHSFCCDANNGHAYTQAYEYTATYAGAHPPSDGALDTVQPDTSGSQPSDRIAFAWHAPRNCGSADRCTDEQAFEPLGKASLALH